MDFENQTAIVMPMGLKDVRIVGLNTPLVLGAFAFGATALAQISDKFDEAFQAMKRDEKLQFELPQTIPPPKKNIDNSFWDGFGAFLDALAPLFQLIFYGGIAFIIALILYHVGKSVYDTRFERRPKETKDEAPPPLYKPDEEQARILLDEVDALASQGRYQEAVHELLFRSIQDIDIHRPNTIRRSLTSREIASLEFLTPSTREAFATISSVVETSYFGGQKIGKSEFDICRAAYAQFTEKSSWKQAA